MAKITYHTHDNKIHTVDVQKGLTVMEKNYIIRKDELRKKVRRDFHRPTRAERDPKAYSRKEKPRTFHFEIEAE